MQPSHQQGNEFFPGHLSHMFLGQALWPKGPAEYLILVFQRINVCRHGRRQTVVKFKPSDSQTVDIAIPCSPSTLRRELLLAHIQGSCMHSQCLHVFDTSRMRGPQIQKRLRYKTRTTCSLQLYLSTALL